MARTASTTISNMIQGFFEHWSHTVVVENPGGGTAFRSFSGAPFCPPNTLPALITAARAHDTH